jgi:hypothetical protein
MFSEANITVLLRFSAQFIGDYRTIGPGENAATAAPQFSLVSQTSLLLKTTQEDPLPSVDALSLKTGPSILN